MDAAANPDASVVTYRARLLTAIGLWLSSLEKYPGWREWNLRKVERTIYMDDGVPEDSPVQFEFSELIGLQHEVVYQYLGLQQTVSALKDCEYYFRRFPFKGLPVTHSDHVTNICEMYFGRFYEFRERLKCFLNALVEAVPACDTDIGKFIKLFDKIFDKELRTRHSVHHRHRFEDLAIDRVYLAQTLSKSGVNRSWVLERQAAYRAVTREWAARVRKRAARMDDFLEATAHATLTQCVFLVENDGKHLANTPS